MNSHNKKLRSNAHTRNESHIIKRTFRLHRIGFFIDAKAQVLCSFYDYDDNLQGAMEMFTKAIHVALKALEIGAVDVMSKPDLSGDLQIEESKIALVDKVRSAFQSRKKIKLPSVSAHSAKKSHTPETFTSSASHYIPKLIAVGASTGGTEAIKTFPQSLVPPMPPILVVQHMPEKFTFSFAKRLNDCCELTVKEAEEHEPLEDNHIYIAPGNKHMIAKKRNSKLYLETYYGELVNRHRPSVNVLFSSVAEVVGKYAIGVIMTGMEDDGASGLLAMYKKGAFTIAQDESSCVVFGMPHKAILAGAVSQVHPLDEIAGQVCERVLKGIKD